MERSVGQKTETLSQWVYVRYCEEKRMAIIVDYKTSDMGCRGRDFEVEESIEILLWCTLDTAHCTLHTAGMRLWEGGSTTV